MKNELILAITTIGDLLNQKKISRDKHDLAIEGIVLCIPPYQRPYKWQPKNVLQLLDDIEEAMIERKEVYRIGTLILHKVKKDKTIDNWEYHIVDGQQRTISLALLLYCLDPNYDISLLNLIDINQNPFTHRNIYYNYKALERRLNQGDKNNSELAEFIKSQCEMVVVITEDLAEAFQFFDSQNARGKTLYPHDLLKAYHLREMNNVDSDIVANTVAVWEHMDQKKLSTLFDDYLYRIKEWIKGNWATQLSEKNIDMFKGVASKDKYPYAQYYKGAFAYADGVNNSLLPFVIGQNNIVPFQLDVPIIAGKPFFDYAKHYFDILADIQNNDKYVGYFINDNNVIKTLDAYYKGGTGNKVVRLMLDTSILLYVDRFCQSVPSKQDLDLLEQFFRYAFVWAYSLRVQYANVGWLVAQNYIMGTPKRDVKNAFNLYKLITECDTPSSLLSVLANRVSPLGKNQIPKKTKDTPPQNQVIDIDKQDDQGIYCNFLHHFKDFKFWEDQ